MHNLQNSIIIFIIVVVLIACGRYTPTLKQMEMAENLMNTQPDSALAMLDRIWRKYLTASIYVMKEK